MFASDFTYRGFEELVIAVTRRAERYYRRSQTSIRFCPKVPIELLLCATSVFSVPLWVKELIVKTTTETQENTEVAQRNQTFRAKPVNSDASNSVEAFENVAGA